MSVAVGDPVRFHDPRPRRDVQAQLDHSVDEVKQLQRCLNDLVSVVALPAIWNGAESSQIVRTLLDVLLGMLHLDLIYVRLRNPIGDGPVEMARIARSHESMADARELGAVLDRRFGHDPDRWPASDQLLSGGEDIAIVTVQLGLQSEVGTLVAGARREGFPGTTERLLLSVATNQAVIALQEARLLNEQKRVADELDHRVAQRTAELAAANEELRREIVERKLVEERLRREEKDLKRSEAFLAEGQRLSSTGSFFWKAPTEEITWSEQLYRIFGLQPGLPVTLGVIGTHFHPEDKRLLDEMIDRARGEGGDFEYEFRLQMPDGSIKYLHIVAHGTRDSDGHAEYTGAIQDVTQRRLSEEALGKLRSELAHVARVTSLGALTASIAHEVSQPLSGIITNAGTCLRMLDAVPPNVDGARETARRTMRDAHRASDVVTRLRALFAKRDAATEWVDLNDAAREVIALSLSELQRDRIVLRTELDDELPAVAGDRVQLQQVILNLLRNASDAMSGVDDRARQLVIRTEADEGDRVRLTVRDVGIGLAPEGPDRLFDAFYTTKTDGMGIGLAVSRSIIERHQGRLWAAPNDGPGATFAFSLPRGEAGIKPTPRYDG